MIGHRILATAAFVAAACAQLTIIDPTPQAWWVQGSTNTLAWTCDTSSYSSYTVVVTNSNKTILTAPLSLIADIPNYDCSFSVNQQQSSLAVSDSWTIELTEATNLTNVYASSQFSVKAPGTPYPASTATSTATGSAASSSSTSKTGAASVNYIPAGMSMAAAVVLGLVVA